jgi:hypothetical protein
MSVESPLGSNGDREGIRPNTRGSIGESQIVGDRRSDLAKQLSFGSLGPRARPISIRAAQARPGLSVPSCSGAVHRIVVERSQNMEIRTLIFTCHATNGYGRRLSRKHSRGALAESTIAAHGHIIGSHRVDHNTSQDRFDHTGLLPVTWPADPARRPQTPPTNGTIRCQDSQFHRQAHNESRR